MAVGLGGGVAVGEGVAVGTGVAVGSGVAVAVGDGVAVGSGWGVAVAVLAAAAAVAVRVRAMAVCVRAGRGVMGLGVLTAATVVGVGSSLPGLLQAIRAGTAPRTHSKSSPLLYTTTRPAACFSLTKLTSVRVLRPDYLRYSHKDELV